MSLIIPYFLALFIAVNSAGELLVHHAPKSVSLLSKPLEVKYLPDVLTTSLGFTPSKGASWDGLGISNPFHFAEALVVVVRDGSLSPSAKGSHIHLKGSVDEEDLWLGVTRRVEERDSDGTSKLLRLNLADGKSEALESMLGPLDSAGSPPVLSELNMNVTEDRQFVDELMMMQEFAHKVRSGLSADGAPDVWWVELPGLRPVIDLHGQDSPAAEEAEEMTASCERSLGKAFIHAYKGRVVFATLTGSGDGHVRKTRSLMADTTENTAEDDLNLSKDYDENYPVIFNILFWFSIVFFYAIIAVAVFIADMDPGRDSIIYRMTSNRMKKEN